MLNRKLTLLQPFSERLPCLFSTIFVTNQGNRLFEEANSVMGYKSLSLGEALI